MQVPMSHAPGHMHNGWRRIKEPLHALCTATVLQPAAALTPASCLKQPRSPSHSFHHRQQHHKSSTQPT